MTDRNMADEARQGSIAARFDMDPDGPTQLGTEQDFLAAHAKVFGAITEGRAPKPLEVETARTLWKASLHATCGESALDGQLITVSAVTGAGKTKAALAMLVHLYEQGRTATLVLPEIVLIEENFLDLVKLLPVEAVAMWSSIHSQRASNQVLAQYRMKGLTPTRQFTVEECQRSPILLCTHDAWRAEVREGVNRGVYSCKSLERALVLVDEEPREQLVYTFTGSDVAALADVLSGVVLEDEARAIGWAHQHLAVPHLRAIASRMNEIHDNQAQPQVTAADIVTQEDLRELQQLTWSDIKDRIEFFPRGKREVVAEQMDVVIDALKAAAHGRVFYARGGGAAFHAYDYSEAVRGRTVCLDGTVDLSMRAASQSVYVVKGNAQPSYRHSTVHHVTLPSEIKEKFAMIRGSKVDAYAARPVYAWLREFILGQTKPGEEVLVYWKGSMRDHRFEGTDEPTSATWLGRTVHFATFGAGRGSNKWRHCTVYVQLGEFHLPKGVTIARLGSVLQKVLPADYLRKLSSGRTKDASYRMAVDSHLNVHAKQDAARTALRTFNADGEATAVRCYFIEADKIRLVRDMPKLFPGVDRLHLLGSGENEDRSLTQLADNVPPGTY